MFSNAQKGTVPFLFPELIPFLRERKGKAFFKIKENEYFNNGLSSVSLISLNFVGTEVSKSSFLETFFRIKGRGTERERKAFRKFYRGTGKELVSQTNQGKGNGTLSEILRNLSTTAKTLQLNYILSVF